MVQYTHLNPFPTNNLKNFSKKTNIEIIKTKTFTHISQECTWLCNKVKTSKDIRFCYLWLYVVHQNIRNGYIRISRIYSFINIFL